MDEMDDVDEMGEATLAARFEAERPRLRAMAHRMLGSFAEADDALQDVWIRTSRTDLRDVENLGAWLTTVTSRVCLNQLRSRATKREEPYEGHVPDPVVVLEGVADPEHEAMLADDVGIALLVVLESLSPAERLAFVLHDLFAVGFDDIATIVDRSPAAARQLASRARRRVRGAAPANDQDPARHRQVVDAFFTAARGGDLDGLLALLDPDIELRADYGASPVTALVRGVASVAGRAIMYSDPTSDLTPALVDGRAGVVVTRAGTVVAVMAFTVTDGRIAAIDSLSDPARLTRLPIKGLSD